MAATHLDIPIGEIILKNVCGGTYAYDFESKGIFNFIVKNTVVGRIATSWSNRLVISDIAFSYFLDDDLERSIRVVTPEQQQLIKKTFKNILGIDVAVIHFGNPGVIRSRL